MYRWLRKHWLELILFLFLMVLLIPGLSMPTKVALQRLFLADPHTETTIVGEAISYNWTLFKLDGKKVDFKRSTGQPVFVNFWATWCPPCVAEMPSIQNLYRDYGDDVDFYLVSSEDPEKLSAFLDNYGFDLPIYRAGKHPKALDINSYPTTYVIDTKGHIRIRSTGAARWDAPVVRSLLDSLLLEE